MAGDLVRKRCGGRVVGEDGWDLGLWGLEGLHDLLYAVRVGAPSLRYPRRGLGALPLLPLLARLGADARLVAVPGREERGKERRLARRARGHRDHVERGIALGPRHRSVLGLQARHVHLDAGRQRRRGEPDHDHPDARGRVARRLGEPVDHVGQRRRREVPRDRVGLFRPPRRRPIPGVGGDFARIDLGLLGDPEDRRRVPGREAAQDSRDLRARPDVSRAAARPHHPRPPHRDHAPRRQPPTPLAALGVEAGAPRRRRGAPLHHRGRSLDRPRPHPAQGPDHDPSRLRLLGKRSPLSEEVPGIGEGAQSAVEGAQAPRPRQVRSHGPTLPLLAALRQALRRGLRSGVQAVRRKP